MFQLRPLVRVLGVLDGEVVQLEFALHPVKQVAAGLPEADPDDMPLLPGPGAGLVDRYVRDAAAAFIDAGRDDAVFETAGRSNIAYKAHLFLPTGWPRTKVGVGHASLFLSRGKGHYLNSVVVSV